MSNNIVLTGMMGAGKSSVAVELVSLLPSYRLVELDSEIEKNQCLTINEIFEKKGENYFREIESSLLKKFLTEKNLVISLGGGAFLSEVNRAEIKLNAFSVYLETSIETIFSRIKNDDSRPLLKSNDVLSKIREILELRKPLYELADCKVTTDDRNVSEIAQEILERYKEC